MSKYFNYKYSPAPFFKIGDQVIFDRRNLKIKRSVKKLNYKIYSLYIVIKLVGTYTI